MTRSSRRAKTKPTWVARSMSFVNRTFVRGLVAVFPIVLTIYLLWWIGSRAEAWLGSLLASVAPDGVYVPGMGLVAGLLIIFIIGLVLRGWVTRSVLRWGERVIDRIPLVKTIYGAIKDLMGFFATSDDKERLNKVVLVELSPGVRLLGFLTRERAQDLTKRSDDSESVAVYLPMSYQIGGFLVMVPKSSIKALDMKVDEALRLAVTAGVKAEDEDVA